MLGPGKYDDLCSYCRAQSAGKGVALIIIDGAAGSGFSVQGTIEMHARLPELLEEMAKQIRADLQSAE